MPDMLFADSKPTNLEYSAGNVVPVSSTGDCFEDGTSYILFWPDLLFTNNCESPLCRDNGELSPTAVNSDAITDSSIQSNAEDVDILFMPDLLFAADGENTPAAVHVVANTTSCATIPDDAASDILFIPDLMFASPMKDGTVRFMNDFRELNKRIKQKPHLIPVSSLAGWSDPRLPM
jgi:hypothetical protein